MRFVNQVGRKCSEPKCAKPERVSSIFIFSTYNRKKNVSECNNIKHKVLTLLFITLGKVHSISYKSKSEYS